MLMLAVICMVGALGFYSYAVFDGRKWGLGSRHLVSFGLGLVLDYYGTGLMQEMIAHYGEPPWLHNFTGHYSLLGMAFHFLLALLATLFGGFEWVNRIFHKISIYIYLSWMIAFLTGAFLGIMVSVK